MALYSLKQISFKIFIALLSKYRAEGRVGGRVGVWLTTDNKNWGLDMLFILSFKLIQTEKDILGFLSDTEYVILCINNQQQ